MKKHLYHLVDESPWPLITAMSVQSMLLGGVMYMQSVRNGLFVLFLGLLCTIYCAAMWWRDVIREATFEGEHTTVVQRGLRIGMLLFILSEIMFFFAFFWAYFHSSLAPTVEIGSIWPPVGIATFNPWEVPFLNTIILLLSGATITWAHHAIVCGEYFESKASLEVTISLAIAFTILQGYEYREAAFSISDGIYGSTFFMATGFHGFHVIIGTIFITICKYRLENYQFTREHHVGFEAAAWYWHFVDAVWLFLFSTIYWWGNL